MIARQPLQRQQRGSTARRRLVLESPPQQLDLLAVAELRNRAIGDRAFAVVARAGRRLELVVPLCAQRCELALLALFRERVGLPRRVRKARHAPTVSSDRAAGPMYRAEGRIRRPVFICSRMCADHPATRAHPNIAGVRSGGMSAMSRTIAAQYSTFVSS